MKPVTLPPGRDRLATKPLPTGSETFAKMMGMVRVCCSINAVMGVFCVRMRSGCSPTSSFANRCIKSASAAAQRASIRMLRPSVHPSVWSPSLERREIGLSFPVVHSIPHQHADAPHPLALLRVCGERPRECSTAERGYKLPPSDVDCHFTPRWGHARCDNTIAPQHRVCEAHFAVRLDPNGMSGYGPKRTLPQSLNDVCFRG